MRGRFVQTSVGVESLWVDREREEGEREEEGLQGIRGNVNLLHLCLAS